MNITFYNDAVDPKIPEMQKKVFDALEIPIEQFNLTDDWQGHGGTVDNFLKMMDQANVGKNITFILWDVDCIPLNADIVNEAHAFADAGGIMSIAQKASHIPNSIIYASPAFLAFSLETWRKLGRPTFACTERSDCAGELTHLARENGVEVRLLYPTHVSEPLWQLDGSIMFGKGTTFGKNDIYHAFYSRKGNTDLFVDKCNEVLALLS